MDETDVLVEIRADDSRPIYVQIIDEVRRSIVAGGLDGDDPLPSVRELASRLQVNPNTVSRAYRELERDGIVYVRRGRGTFVSPDANREADRHRLAREVAKRALRDARRHSLTADELVASIRALSDGGRGGGDHGARDDSRENEKTEERDES